MENPFRHDPVQALREVIAAEDMKTTKGTFLQHDMAKSLGVTAAFMSMIMNHRKALTLPMIRMLHIKYGMGLEVLLSPTQYELKKVKAKRARKRAKK